MEKIITNKNDINSLKDLLLYQKQLQGSYLEQQDKLKKELKSKITSLPNQLFSSKNKLHIDNSGKVQLPPAKKLISHASGWLVKTVLPKKTGFITRWLVGLVVKKTVTKVIEKVPIKENTMIRKKRERRLF